MTEEQIEIVESHIRNRRGFAEHTYPEVAAELNLITDAVEAMLAEWRLYKSLLESCLDEATMPAELKSQIRLAVEP